MIYVLAILVGLLVLGTFVPLIDHDHWLIRSQEYIKPQYLVLHIIMIVLVLVCLPWGVVPAILILASLIAGYRCIRVIIPFTPLVKRSVFGSSGNPDRESLRILILNVYQFNTNYQATIDLIRDADPDVFFLVETNEAWCEGLSELADDYPYVLQEIREDTYGMIFRSKIAFQQGSVQYIVEDDIPSIEALLRRNGHTIRIYGIHPKPPVPTEDETSTSKDLELLAVAGKISNLPEDEHAVLIGDLNDVAWSRLSRMMINMTSLVDPRVGRGFYATFPAWSPIRIPLDHVFFDSKFKLLDFRVLKSVDSDHLPVLIEIQL